MADLFSVLERHFLSLAEDLNYHLSTGEIEVYVRELSSLGLKKLATTLLAVREEKRPSGTFPTILEIRRTAESLI